MELLHGLMGEAGPARVRRQQRGLVAVEQVKLFTAALTQKATVPSRLTFSCPGTASASGLWVQQTRWLSTELPSLAISPSRPVAACWAARAARSAPRSRTVSSATSSINAKFPDQLAMAAGFPTHTERRPSHCPCLCLVQSGPGMSARGRVAALSSIPGQLLYIADRRVPLLRSPPETSSR